MKQGRHAFQVSLVFWGLTLWQSVGHAALPSAPDYPAPGRGPMAADSPFSNYTAAVVVQVLLIAVLVLTLLGGMFLVLNLGLLSKRAEDRVGERDPSDVGVLKHERWPEEPYVRSELPAIDEEYEPDPDLLEDPSRKRAA